MNSKFERDTTVTEVEPGVFEGVVDRDWWIVFGPNGGFLAAMFVRAIAAAVADEARQPRSLTIHYTAAPEEGLVRITTAVERAGRSLTTVSARMEQNGRLIALALAAYSACRASLIEYDELPMPEVEPPEKLQPTPAHPGMPPFSRQWEIRFALGEWPFTGSPGPTITGGWIKPLENHPLDAALVAQLTDAWLPAVFIRLTQPDAVPTVDLTIHFRGDLPQPADFAFVTFESRLSHGGFIEEDGRIWSRSGQLIAHSRQLALLQARSQD